jgi:very-short-patch-repair endonuclease
MQYEVVAGNNSYRLDLAYPENHLAIEIDGYAFHSSRESFDNDRRRDNNLRSCGWTILHFTSNSEPFEIVNQIRLLLS